MPDLRGSHEPVLPAGLPGDVARGLEIWSKAGIGSPFIPEIFVHEIRELGQWSWGCIRGAGRDEQPGDPIDAYMLRPEIQRFTTGDWRPRFHVCHAGHGSNSYSINYVIVTERLAIFAQAGWGGFYMDKGKAAATVQDLSNDLARLVAATDAIRDWPDRRLIVVQSNFRRVRTTEWIDRPGSQPTRVVPSNAAGVAGALEIVRDLRSQDQA